MLILVGPSASGKTVIAKKLIESYGFLKFVTTTTRKPRVGELDGVDYFFISKDEFLEKEKNDEFIETTLYNDNYYGTQKNNVSFNKVLIVDINGANKFFEKIKDEAVYFYIKASHDVIVNRMIERGDAKEDIEKRLKGDSKYFDIKLLNHIDYVIDNTNETIDDVTKDIYNKYIERIKK